MNWVALKSLNELYRNKETKIKETLIKDSLFQHLLNDTQEIKEGYKVYYSDDEDFFDKRVIKAMAEILADFGSF